MEDILSYFPVTGVNDTNNGSTTPLGASSTWTGSATITLPYSSIHFSLTTDQTGTIYIDYSTDGTNWDIVRSIYHDSTEHTSASYGFVPRGKYYRLRFVNGAVAQTYFRIQSVMHHTKGTAVDLLMNEEIDRHSSVLPVRVINDPDLDVARGLIHSSFDVYKFGANAAVPNGTFELVWETTGTYVWPTLAETVRIKSGGNPADTVAGLGAQTVTIEGLDENYDQASDTVDTAGASSSAATTVTFSRVFRAYVATCGTYTASNTGDIILEGVTTANTYATLSAEIGQSQMALYTVPAGYSAFLRAIATSVAALKPVDLRMYQRQNADDITTPFSPVRLVQRWVGFDRSLTLTFSSERKFPEKTDLWFEASGSGAVSEVTVDFEMRVVKN